jgi:predicted amidohydrolase
MTATVGIAQIEPVLGDVKSNVDLHLQKMAEARDAGCDLLIFPELSLTGYHLREKVAGVAMTADHPELVRLVADVGPMVVVVGCVWEEQSGLFTNASLVIEDGRVLARHDKVYLPNYGPFEEARWFCRGRRIAAVDSRIGRIGVTICEESWHLSVPYLLWLDGTQLMIIQTASSARPEEVDNPAGSAQTCQLQNRFYAKMLGAFVVFANRVGREGDFVFWGGSEVVSPQGVVLSRAARFEPDLLVQGIDLGEVRQARIALPLLRDEDRELTYRHLRRTLS